MFYDNFTIKDADNQIKTVSNKSYAAEFVEKLRNYRLIDEQSSGVFVLKRNFAHNLVSMLSSNLRLDLKKPKNNDSMVSIEN